MPEERNQRVGPTFFPSRLPALPWRKAADRPAAKTEQSTQRSKGRELARAVDQTTPLGQQLKDARAIKHVSLEEAEKQTKVRLRHLSAIEEGRYHELPPDVFAVGFVRKYARLIDLDPEVAATMFRQERAAGKTAKKKGVSLGPSKRSNRPRLILSTRLVTSVAVALVVLLLFGYIWYQVRLFAAPPQLTLTSPRPDSVVAEATVTLTGKTSPTATLFVNTEPTPLDEEGQFRQDVKLSPGVNTIEIKAVNRLGKEAMETLHVLYQAPVVEPLTPLPIPQ